MRFYLSPALFAFIASPLRAQTDPPECERPSFLRRIITTDADGATSVFAADLDGDGDIDVLSASWINDTIAWYENTDGQGNFGPQRIITTDADSANSVFAADIDGDGDVDVLSASGGDNRLAWYENKDGLGTYGLPRIITTDVGSVPVIFAADVDGDGDVDVLSSSQGDNKIAWYQNTDGLGNFGPKRIITTEADGANSVFAADLDRDGDVDVLSASVRDNKIAWYENTDGLGDFGPQRVITTDASIAVSVFAADLDGDGDVDVLSGSLQEGKVAWYENLNGLGDFGPQQVITTEAPGVGSVFAADLDGDGDVDVLSASQSGDKIAWYENTDGQGNFGQQLVISTSADAAHSVFAADLDSDGDVDVLSASLSDNKIAWYENEADCNGNGINDGCDLDNGESQDCNLNFIPDGCDIADGISVDCDGNGVPDECEPDCNGNNQTDSCDIADGISADCNNNGIPDECEDCNQNGIGDECDIRDGTSLDCQLNGVPDECDIETLASQDVDLDGIPDECQSCESVVPATIPLASLKAVSVNDVPIEPTNCLSAARGDVITAELFISGWGQDIDWLRAYQVAVGGNEDATSGDFGTVLPVGWEIPLVPVPCTGGMLCPDGLVCGGTHCLGPNHDPRLGAFVEQRSDFVFDGFNVVAAEVNVSILEYFYFGVIFEALGPADRGQFGYIGTLLLEVSPDACGSFTYGPVQNAIARASFFLQEPFDESIFPFSLQPLRITVPDCDCNENGLLDPMEIADNPSIDCDGNFIPDSCDMQDCDGDRGCLDCNGNNIMDACEILDDPSRDEDGNGIPDDCFFPIPTVSAWGMGVMALLLLVAAKVQSLRDTPLNPPL